MVRARNLAAFLLAVQLVVPAAGCEHVPPSARTGRNQLIEERGFTGRWLVPDVPAPGGPALLIFGIRAGSEAATGSAGFSARLATAAMEAGVAALELRGGDPGQALLWLGPRARRLFVAATGESLASVATLLLSGHVAGLVLFQPPAMPASGGEPCLVIRGGEPASKQSGVLWEVSFPDLEPGRTLTPDDEHSILEVVTLWLRARADEK
jgi:hypothetical protein